MNRFTLLVAVLILNLSISGCLTEKIDDNEVKQPDEYEWVDDGELTIVTYDVYGLTDEMLANFENESGYEVNLLKLDDAGSVLDHLLQHKGQQVADIAIGLDNTYLQTAIDNNVFWEHNAILENISVSALSPYDGPLAVPFDQGYICLNYDSDIVDGVNYTVPESLWELTEEEWEGKVAIPSPETSSPGRSFMTATTEYFSTDSDNETEWTDWWSAMSLNDVIITTGWSEAYEARYTGGYGEWTDGYVGDAHIVLSYCHSPGVESWYNGNWTKSAALDIPKASFHQVEYAAALEGGNLDSASAFIEYLLSPEVNSKMPLENSMYSALEGFDLPEENGYLFHSVVPSDPAVVSSTTIANNMEEWLEMWNKAMVDA